MTLRAQVKSHDYLDEDDDQDLDLEGQVLASFEFEDHQLIALLSRCFDQIEKQKTRNSLEIITPDCLLAYLENGGEIDRSDMEILLEEIQLLQDNVDDFIGFAPQEKALLDTFFDELFQLAAVSCEIEANIEFYNDEESESLEEDSTEASEFIEQNESEPPKAEETLIEEDDDDFDDDLDPELQSELEREFENEYGEPPF